MKYKKKYQREDKNDLLKAIFEAGGLLTLSLVMPNAAGTLYKHYYEHGQVKTAKLYQAVYRLRKSGLISIAEDKPDSVTLKLEKEGEEKVIKMNLDDLKLEKPEKWDGLWRIVIFDIPDQHKTARNYLSSLLGNLGFIVIQKSIYAHPYPCEEIVEMIRSVYGVRPFVKLILAKEIEDDHKLLAKFGLSRLGS